MSYRLSPWVSAAVVAAVVAVVALVLGISMPRQVPAEGHPGARAEGLSTPAKLGGLDRVAVCDTRLTAGPRRPPRGAVAVHLGDNLARATARRPPGTTFWLSPGAHRLSAGTYDNVIAKQGNTYLGAPGAILDGRHRNLYAFAGKASGVTISHLTIRNFGARGGNNNQGVVNHDSATRWRILGSTIERNAGAGVMVGSHNVLRNNCLRANGQYGFNVYRPLGVSDIVLDHNEIVGNNTDDWESRRPGCGCSGGGKFWATVGARVTDNWVHDNRGVGLWADTNNSGFLVQGNVLSNNDDVGLLYEISYNARIVGNRFVRNGIVGGRTNPGFPTPAIYVSESGSDVRAPGPYGRATTIAHNRFVDNWSGVVLWENADRFCGSPANSSTGDCTLVNSPAVNTKTCSNHALIATKPYYDDCRWKTRNVKVHDNRFVFRPSRLGAGCTAQRDCGVVGVFSNYGTYPSWSPFKGTLVERAVTLQQGNEFSNNTYVGPWRFMARELGNVVPWQVWRAAPYSQDRGSLLR